MKEKKEQHTISRRDFLRGMAASAVGVAATSVIGTSAFAEGTGKEKDVQQPAGAPGYEVYNTDLLIIGAGFGAMSAAFEAISKGQSVVMIDKGPFRHGGNSGYNWDVIATWCPDPDSYSKESYLTRVVNQEMYYKADSSEPNQNMGLTLINRGECLPSRNEDGSINYYLNYPQIRGVEGVFPRHDMDALAKSALVTVFDRTMITDVMINDGICLGAMGVYLPTGEFRVFRAKATILSTGPSTWFYGWNTVAANTIASPDNTGDVEMACFRHGVGIGDSEYAAYDFATTYPEGLGYGWGTMMNPDANEYFAFCDKDGNRLFTEDSGIDLTRVTYDRTYFNSNLAKMMYDGAATESGGLISKLENIHLRPAMQKNMKVFEKFGVDPFGQDLEIHDEIYERGGAPVIDDGMMSEIKGLFCVRGAGVQGTGGGSSVVLNNRFGSYTTRCALKYMKNTEAFEKVDWAPVESEFARLEELRTRKVDGGYRPFEVRHMIQKACGTCMGILRAKEKLEECDAELKRIREEVMPKMAVSTDSLVFNQEWKEAIENYNLLDCAQLAVEATLTREESRGTYLRPDFPDPDDENWKCMLVGYWDDGAIRFEKKVMPEHDWA